MNVSKYSRTADVIFNISLTYTYTELLDILESQNLDKKTRRKLQHFFDDFNLTIKNSILIYTERINHFNVCGFISRLDSMKIPENIRFIIKMFLLNIF